MKTKNTQADRNSRLKIRPAVRRGRRKRHLIQALGALAFNAHLTGFFNGQIYQGQLKKICVPVLNCYSCPGAIGSCPIGSIQAMGVDRRFHFGFYALGLVMLFGILAGRFFCGFLCPFGFLQDLVHKLKTRKVRPGDRLNRHLSKLKYLVLLVAVFLLPALYTDSLGINSPVFCKYICPAGTLGGGLPLIILQPDLRSLIGWLFGWKMVLALAIVIGSVFVYRLFCRFLCPLGALLGLLQPFSFYRLLISNRCINCGQCRAVCKMQVDPVKTPNSPECIRCLDCLKQCPVGAIETSYPLKSKRRRVQ